MRAIVTIIDEKTGEVYVENQQLEPTRIEDNPRDISIRYDWRISLRVVKDDFFKSLDNGIGIGYPEKENEDEDVN